MIIKTATPRDAARKPTLFLAYFQKEPLDKEVIFSSLPARMQTLLRAFAKKEFRGEEGEIKTLWLPQKRIVLFGLGEKSKWNERKSHLVPRRFVQYAKTARVAEFACSLRPLKDAALAATRFAVNAVMADFAFTHYKEKPKQGWPEVQTISLAVEKSALPEAAHGLKEGIVIGEEINHCRVLANTPGGDMTPMRLANAAAEAAKRTGISVKILDEKAMKRLGMGGVLGVARGSSEKPAFIILEHRKGPKNQKPLVLVGKGVTFDTGGLNLKPEKGISEMHMDMSGGAAVIHGIAAIARLALPINVIGLIPAVENMPSGSSYHPGDILKTITGKTIEVGNTDAEGRVILADALGYAARLSPGLVVDIATLTGAAMSALGMRASGLFTADEKRETLFRKLGEASGDYLWPLPLWDEYQEEIKGTFGDFSNIGKMERVGGAITAAMFLKQFVSYPWVHIDMAPTMTTIDSDILAKGAKGTGVRLFVELAKEYIKGTI